MQSCRQASPHESQIACRAAESISIQFIKFKREGAVQRETFLPPIHRHMLASIPPNGDALKHILATTAGWLHTKRSMFACRLCLWPYPRAWDQNIVSKRTLNRIFKRCILSQAKVSAGCSLARACFAFATGCAGQSICL